jgi:hypothetical protein
VFFSFTERLLNDIALMKLKKNVPAGDEFEKIHKVELPQQGERDFPTENQQCVVKGWGCAKYGRVLLLNLVYGRSVGVSVQNLTHPDSFSYLRFFH